MPSRKARPPRRRRAYRRSVELPECSSIRSGRGWAEPEIWFRIVHVAADRVVELLREAIEWESLLESGEVSNQTAISRREESPGPG